jgi:hypothetical protein
VASGILQQRTKAAIYARVSTTNHGQDVSTQTRDLEQFAKARGWRLVDSYLDVGISGIKDKRPQLDRLMADAHKRRFDIVDRVALRQICEVGLSSTPSLGDVQRTWHRVRQSERANGHHDANRQDDIHGSRGRRRVRAQLDRGTCPGRAAECTRQGKDTGPPSSRS